MGKHIFIFISLHTYYNEYDLSTLKSKKDRRDGFDMYERDLTQFTLIIIAGLFHRTKRSTRRPPRRVCVSHRLAESPPVRLEPR